MLDYLACFYLEPHGVIGGHEAANRQLLLIIRGDGRRGADESLITMPINRGRRRWQVFR
jgi:hypothetical protein